MNESADPDRDVRSLFDAYRRCEEHENEVMHHRTTWFVTVQSVLVATFGFSYQKYYEISERITETFSGKPALAAIRAAMAPADIRYQFMLLILCIIGVVSSLGAFSGIGAARTAQSAIRTSWERLHRDKADAIGLPPSPHVEVTANGDLGRHSLDGWLWPLSCFGSGLRY